MPGGVNERNPDQRTDRVSRLPGVDAEGGQPWIHESGQPVKAQPAFQGFFPQKLTNLATGKEPDAQVEQRTGGRQRQ